MALSDTQLRQLKAKLDPKHIKTRRADGVDLHYVEGWHAVSEANRIFGFDAWDRRTLVNICVWSGASGQHFVAAYTAKVRISVRVGDVTVVRDGSGSGEGKAATRGQAHDLALKAAETDATKRALSTFGNPFGLALYDPEQRGVRRAKSIDLPTSWSLRTASGEPQATFEKPSDFAAALRAAMSEAADIEVLFALWEHNVDAVRSLNKVLKQRHLKKSGAAAQLVEHLKRCAVDLAAPRNNGSGPPKPIELTPNGANGPSRRKVDKSVLTISEPKRIRCKEHLRFVARQPCVICGRQPTHAHHLRHAQDRGVGLKVSDEFTVPLCAIHHNEVHRVGKEESWWRERNIEPLAIARGLWRQSLGGGGSAAVSATSRDREPDAGVSAEERRP